MALTMLSPEEMGERVWKAYRLSGFETATDFARALMKVDPSLKSINRNLLGDLRQGRAKIVQRLPLIASVIAGTGALVDATPEQVLAYLRGDIELRDQPVKSPSNGGRQTLDRVKEPTGWSGNVTTGVRAS